MKPVPVEIISSSAWWLPWLPVIGSVLVAAAAFAGVVISNKTNRTAIRSARILDHHKWLRETLVRLGSEAAEHAFEIDRLYNKRSFAVAADDTFDAHMLVVGGEMRKLSATADSLSIIGFEQLAAKCAEIRLAADKVIDPAQHHHDAVQTAVSKADVDATRAAVDVELKKLAAARERFVSFAQSALKAHALVQIDFT